MKRYGSFIDNEMYVPSGTEISAGDYPYAGEPWAVIVECGPDELDFAMASVRAAHRAGAWSNRLIHQIFTGAGD